MTVNDLLFVMGAKLQPNSPLTGVEIITLVDESGDWHSQTNAAYIPPTPGPFSAVQIVADTPPRGAHAE